MGENSILDFNSVSDFFKRQEKSVSIREELEKKIENKEILLDKNNIPDLSKIKDSKLRQSYYEALELTYYDKKAGTASVRYEKGLEIATTKKQDQVFREYASEKLFKDYYFFGNNCKDLVSRGLNKAGISNQNTAITPPSIWYESLKTWYVNEQTGYLTEERKAKKIEK
jgi:hypothetical protein